MLMIYVRTLCQTKSMQSSTTLYIHRTLHRMYLRELKSRFFFFFGAPIFKQQFRFLSAVIQCLVSQILSAAFPLT